MALIQKDSENTLLSFLYHVSYGQTVNDQFHDNPTAVMRKFNVSSEAQGVFTELGNLEAIPSNDDKRMKLVTKLMGYLADEFSKGQSTYLW